MYAVFGLYTEENKGVSFQYGLKCGSSGQMWFTMGSKKGGIQD